MNTSVVIVNTLRRRAGVLLIVALSSWRSANFRRTVMNHAGYEKGSRKRSPDFGGGLGVHTGRFAQLLVRCLSDLVQAAELLEELVLPDLADADDLVEW